MEIAVLTHGLLFYPYLIAIRVVAICLDERKTFGFKQEYAFFIALWSMLTLLSLVGSLAKSSGKSRKVIKIAALLMLVLGAYWELYLPTTVHLVR